jgi:hypothetical protein
MVGFVIMVLGIVVLCYGYYRHREYRRQQLWDEEDRLRLIRRRDLEKTLLEGNPAEQQTAKYALDELDEMESKDRR